MSDIEEGSVQDNMQKGKGIVPKGKDGFRVIGMDESDRNHPEITGEPSRNRGRPPKDENFRIVGQSIEEEQNNQSK